MSRKFKCVCMYVCVVVHVYAVPQVLFQIIAIERTNPSCAFVKLKQTLIIPYLGTENQNLHLTERGNCYSRNFFLSTPPLPVALVFFP